jgi:hypothetical protein
MIHTNIFKLQDDETIVAKQGYHWIVYVGIIANGVFLVFLPLILFLFAERFDFLMPTPLTLHFMLLAYTVWILAIWTATVAQLTILALNQWVITDRRIVSIDQSGFFNTLIASWQYNNIVEVSAEKSGILQTFLNYGHIEIQTAGMADDYEQMDNVSDPENVRSLILEQIDAYSTRRNEQRS